MNKVKLAAVVGSSIASAFLGVVLGGMIADKTDAPQPFELTHQNGVPQQVVLPSASASPIFASVAPPAPKTSAPAKRNAQVENNETSEPTSNPEIRITPDPINPSIASGEIVSPPRTSPTATPRPRG